MPSSKKLFPPLPAGGIGCLQERLVRECTNICNLEALELHQLGTCIDLIGARLGGALLQIRDPGINGFPFHQHLFDVTPLLEQELVVGPVGIIKDCILGGKILDSSTNPGQEGRSGSSGDIDVRGGYSNQQQMPGPSLQLKPKRPSVSFFLLFKMRKVNHVLER
jgi:hypothetical protein